MASFPQQKGRFGDLGSLVGFLWTKNSHKRCRLSSLICASWILRKQPRSNQAGREDFCCVFLDWQKYPEVPSTKSDFILEILILQGVPTYILSAAFTQILLYYGLSFVCFDIYYRASLLRARVSQLCTQASILDLAEMLSKYLTYM